MRRSILVGVVAVSLLAGCTSVRQWAYESGRDDWQKADEIVAALEIQPGTTVADLGAGSGYFTGRLAAAVGPQGRVFAVDVDEKMNERLRQRLAEEGVANAEVLLGRYDDPLLPDGKIDLIFSSNTYHHIEDRPVYFANLQADLAPGGRVAILDHDGRKGWFVKLFGHFVEQDVILDEMSQAGYRLDADLPISDRQSFLVFSVM